MSPINNKLVAALLLLASPAFAAGVCIVCPPGYDCSNANPSQNGAIGQVLTRTATGTAWQAYEPPALTWDNITDKPATFAPAEHTHSEYVPTTRKIAGVALSSDISKASLAYALHFTPKSFDIEYGCSTTNGHAATAGNPTIISQSSGTIAPYCWCRFWTEDIPGYYSAWVFGYGEGGGGPNCFSMCYDTCRTSTAWRAASTW